MQDRRYRLCMRRCFPAVYSGISLSLYPTVRVS